MLLYNQKKEFVGIDDDDLIELGFQNINELLEESHDFADLFVKKPGYIHNFKNFSWIDFILHSEADESKAIIHSKGKNFSCSLHIEKFHFVSQESGYCVNIKNLRILKGAEDAQATKDLEASGGLKTTAPTPISIPSAEVNVDVKREETPIPEPITEPIQEVIPEPQIENERLDINLDDIEISPEPSNEPELPSFNDSSMQELSEPEPFEIPEEEDDDLDINFDLPQENEFGAPLDINYDDLKLDEPEKDEFKDLTAEPEVVLEEEIHEDETPMLGDYVSDADSEHLSELVKSGDYKYNPQIAADELGLPVDLIEEFIGDFIAQAHEFNEDLYASVSSEDYDNVQVLSHKLKGVAANLRIEDAFDVLGVINSSKDNAEIMPNLNQFYRIIAKLEGKELPVQAAPVVAAPTPSYSENDVYDDLLAQPQEEEEAPTILDENIAPLEDDIYADLLAENTQDEPEIVEEVPVTQNVDDEDDIYDNLLGSIEEDLDPIPEPTPPVEPEINLEPEISLESDLALESDFELDTNLNFEAPLELEDDFTLEDELPDLTLEEIAPQEDLHVEIQEETPEVVLNFDITKSANELGIPEDIVGEFVQDFKEQIISHKGDFETAISANDMDGVNKTATLLKGMSDNLRLSDISDVLQRLQKETDVENTSKDLAILQAYSDQL